MKPHKKVDIKHLKSLVFLDAWGKNLKDFYLLYGVFIDAFLVHTLYFQRPSVVSFWCEKAYFCIKVGD